jgi:hypothetical protein
VDKVKVKAKVKETMEILKVKEVLVKKMTETLKDKVKVVNLKKEGALHHQILVA